METIKELFTGRREGRGLINEHKEEEEEEEEETDDGVRDHMSRAAGMSVAISNLSPEF